MPQGVNFAKSQGGKMKSFKMAGGGSGRIAFVRISAGSDLVQSLKSAFEKTGFAFAYVPVCIGSLKAVRYTFVRSDGRYSETLEKKGYFEILALGGFFSEVGKGVEFHLHGVFADSNGEVFGGHIAESGNIVYATCEVCLAESPEIRISKRYDDETGFEMFKIF